MFRFREKWYYLGVLIIVCICGLFSGPAQAARFKVLVVMSYGGDYPWVQEIKEGIESALGNACEIRYFYMDTKKDPEGGPKKAKEAYELYQTFGPDGVITADDNAQSMFVVPYLKDKVKTPVMFNGVNDEAETYGYPASNVSGILQRFHVKESLTLAQQILPSVKTFGLMTRNNPTGNAIFKQIKGESDTYPAKFVTSKMPKTLKEAVTMTEDLKKSSDALYMAALQGVTDEDGKPVPDKRVMPMVGKIFGKPTMTAAEFEVKLGVLCAVLTTGQEQGETSANMLMKAMQGTPVSQIPITQNRHGKRVINVTVLKSLGIRLKPAVLRTVELVRTEK